MLFSSRISLLIFCLDAITIGNRGVLKSPTTTVSESICAFKLKLSVLTLGAYRLIMIISFWCIAPFIGMKCPSLSHLINVSLKSTLADISIAIPACFGGIIGLVNLLPTFHPKPVVSLSIRWVFLLIQYTNLCLLMEELNLLTFNVNIDRYVVILAI
jgi:hypothetical protein